MYIAQAAAATAISVVVKVVLVILQKTANYLFPDERDPIEVSYSDDIISCSDDLQLMGDKYGEDLNHLSET